MNPNQSLQLDIYINYPGHCEAAFRFYEKVLGGKIRLMLPHEQVPPHFPKEWTNPILHAIIEIGGTLVRGADVADAAPMRSASSTLKASVRSLMPWSPSTSTSTSAKKPVGRTA